MTSPSTRLGRVPVVGGVVDLPYADEIVDRVPFALRGLFYGVLAFAVGYGLLFGLLRLFMPSIPAPFDFLVDLADVSLPGDGQIAGWIFYMAHDLQIHYPTLLGSKTGNLLDAGLLKLALLYPPFVLTITGAIIARSERDLRDAALVGASIAVGYALVFVLFANDLHWKESILVRDFEIWVVQGAEFLPRAIGYPLAFGAIGGVLSGTVLGPVLSWIRNVLNLPFR